jgi:hypothetical protein
MCEAMLAKFRTFLFLGVSFSPGLFLEETMNEAPRAPQGMFQIFLVDAERNGFWPGEEFEDFGDAERAASKLNLDRDQDDEHHYVFDEKGRNLTFSSENV